MPKTRPSPSHVNGATKTVVVPEGLTLRLDIPGLHYNPKYWEDPYTFKPERFLGDWNRDAFLPSAVVTEHVREESERIDIIPGHPFEFVQVRGNGGNGYSDHFTFAIYHFHQDEPQFAGETYEQRKDEILNAQSRLTLAPTRLPLVFKRRT
ncbi:hypothetical protein DFH29DRAFT_1083704 [Suillus ampliporus]|nr:hypothetical protein DFH29DRAFT_1083704 [Suillus ampliporus]